MGGSLEIFFDNIGKYVVKNYRINSAGPKRADIITTAISISPSSVPHIQADISLKPQKNHFGWKITEMRFQNLMLHTASTVLNL